MPSRFLPWRRQWEGVGHKTASQGRDGMTNLFLMDRDDKRSVAMKMIRVNTVGKKITFSYGKKGIFVVVYFCQLFKFGCMSEVFKFDRLAISMFSQKSYPHKTVAFIKVRYPDGEKILSFVIDKNRDLKAFCDRMVNPINRLGSQKITAGNCLWIAFHKKVKGDKSLSMEANAEYLCSWSPTRSFYDKREVAAMKRNKGLPVKMALPFRRL